MASVHGTDLSEILDAADGVTNGNDSIHGHGGNDSIFGLAGNDIILGGSGADHIDGDAGSDTASYSDSTTGVIVSLITGQGYGGTAEGDTLTSIENLSGSWYEDVLFGNAGANTLTGLGGNDILDAGSGADKLYGGSGEDTLKGGGGADVLDGDSGFDTASYAASGTSVYISLTHDVAQYGDAEGDTLIDIENVTGSAYDDDLWGAGGNNTLRGNDGDDTLKGFGGSDKLYGGDDNDSLYGMDEVDTLRGEDGDDIIDGGADYDYLIGGIGNDSYYVDNGSDSITEFGSDGNDIVYSTAYGYTLPLYVETLSLDTATDTGVYATGNYHHNGIFGNGNDNVLNGGGANDILSGLGGNDIFVFQAGEAHGDVVYEFEGNGAGLGDQLQFVGYGAGATFTQFSATEWIIASADGTISEVITFIGGPAIDPTDYVIY